MRTTVMWLVVIAGALGAGCGEQPTAVERVPPASGAVVSLTTPHADDGAIVVTVQGPDLGTLAAASPSYVIYSRMDSSRQEARVIVIGDVVAGPLFTMTFASPHELSLYSAHIDQVALRSDSLRTELAGYRATLARP